MIKGTIRNIKRTAQFKKEYKLAKKQGKDVSKALDIIRKLANDEPLHERYCDHQLSGKWKDFRECHIAPDWLLVYKKTDADGLVLILTRLASHSDLGF